MAGTAAAATDEQGGEGTPTKTFSQDDLNAAVASERRAGKEKIDSLTKERDDAVALRTQSEERYKEIETKLSTTSKDALKFKVALDAGLPSVLAERLSGDDEDSLKADASKLSELIAKPKGGDGQLVGGPNDNEPPKPESSDMNARIRRAAGRE